ncbi:subtilisin-like protease SBT3.3 isoform X3 [Typha latifolia]|uniref:subtilisin-like protease SBT3.3 isoform X3 n=2 Tax=Typha TaxID=4732 RepID=UPI003C2D8293
MRLKRRKTLFQHSSPRLLLLLALVSLEILMAEESTNPGAEEATVQIVYVDRPEGEDPEEFHIRVLASVLGSEAAAKEAVIYHYKHVASGFSAKITPKQAEELSIEKSEVIEVVPDMAVQLH